MIHKFAILSHLCPESTKRTLPGLTHLREVETLQDLCEWVRGEEVRRIKVNLAIMKSINWSTQENHYLQHFRNGCKHWAFGIMRRLPNTKVITSAMHLMPFSPLSRGRKERPWKSEKRREWKLITTTTKIVEKLRAIKKCQESTTLCFPMILLGKIGEKGYKRLISYILLFSESSLHSHPKRQSSRVKRVIFPDSMHLWCIWQGSNDQNYFFIILKIYFQGFINIIISNN